MRHAKSRANGERRQRPPQVRIVSTLEELDREIARADAAAQESEDARVRCFREFCFAPADFVPPDDPYSEEYRQAQVALYSMISGRPSYEPEEAERTPFDLAAAVDRPYPYFTRSATIIGEQLQAIGFMIRTMAAPPGARILEFGMGWGTSTMALARSGYDVTAVDIDPTFCELVRAQCRRANLPVEVVRSNMAAFEPSGRFDRVLFYECFHHCFDFVAMVRRLDAFVAEGGLVAFASEPIDDHAAFPWGMRTDGQAAWSIRKFGWMELNFRTDFFLDLLDRHGWTSERFFSKDVGWQNVLVARRKG
jgi:2-polyprenyl-3-methyl-5-hydroxy-6-metoxy-1,4-benzoquinol methylase